MKTNTLLGITIPSFLFGIIAAFTQDVAVAGGGLFGVGVVSILFYYIELKSTQKTETLASGGKDGK